MPITTTSTMPPTTNPTGGVPYRQIRAAYDSETITVYQAYKAEIADPAIAQQKLHASPLFKPSRMTWIKPSWAWMLYRSGYSYKDPGQGRILALRMKHEHFIELLEHGALAHKKLDPPDDTDEKPRVRVQWDPERTTRLDKLVHRSIQIGIPAAMSPRWTETMIVSIEDVTEKARDLKKLLDERDDITDDELIEKGLVPAEKVFNVPEHVQRLLEMG